MRQIAAITALAMLFCTAFSVAKSPAPTPQYPDSLRSVYLYTEGIKQLSIKGDTLAANRSLREAILHDSTYAPAYFFLVSNGLHSSPEEAVDFTNKAYRQDTTNRWYHRFYGQSLILADRYGEALTVFRRILTDEPNEPDNYRILAALYEQQKNPYLALITLDSAEMRFGRIPYLSAMKRRLLIVTHQTEKAITEARALIEATPYEAEPHTALAELYAITNKDSLAREQYAAAMRIDSMDIQTLMSLADYHNNRRNYDAFLVVSKRLFISDALPLESKVRRFELLTGDTRFYREHYSRINDLATSLAIRYPKHRSVVELYGKHLIASGELDQALSLYKLHLEDQPPAEEYYRWVIDIESYKQHPDSVRHYVDRALQLFPQKIEFLLAKGNSLVAMKQYDSSVAAYKQILRRADNDSLRAVVWGVIGDVWHLKAEAEPRSAKSARRACYAAYDRSLKYNKDNALILNNYAYFLSLEGRDLERALEMSSRVVALTDNNPTYLDTHAWVLYRLGRYVEARKILQQAVALDGHQSPELLAHYGDVLHALGEQFMAENYWKRALDRGFNAAQIEQRLQQQPVKAE